MFGLNNKKTMSVYINPYTDFGFKRLFGEEANKELLIDFLNELLPLTSKIASLTFKSPEQMGDTSNNRKAVYDIYCQANDGTFFIVEMQKAFQEYFKDRTIYYSTFPIRTQAKKGKWDYQLSMVYCVAVLAFEFGNEELIAIDEEIFEEDFYHEVELKDQHNRVFYKKLKYIFLEMPNFNKTENQLTTRFEKWIYFLKNLEDFTEIPSILNEPIFQEAFEVAKVANFNQNQLDAYENSLKDYRDYHNTMDSAIKSAVKVAVDEKTKEIIIRTLKRGKTAIEDIADDHDVSIELVLKIQEEIKKM